VTTVNVEEVGKPVEILLVEDNPADVRLTREALRDASPRINLSAVECGAEAMEYLYGEGDYADTPLPDLIILDLGLPGKDGRDVLAEIKGDKNLSRCPVVVLSTSDADEDILKAYDLHVNCYVTKPLDLDQFLNVVQSIAEFWVTIVKLPTNGRR
jgi:chemotaxis family two-component system response regulator Rcp1